jgi:8-oxo-dGTP diphosphatase
MPVTEPAPNDEPNDVPNDVQNDVHVDVRCSVLVMRRGSVLLLGRISPPDGLVAGKRSSLERHQADPAVWVLPGGRPHPGESMAACARREAFEETGLTVQVGRCQFVLEVADPGRGRTIDLVFSAEPTDPRQEPAQAENHLVPTFVPLDELQYRAMRPPIAGYLRGLRTHRDHGAAYLGDMWRPQPDEVGEGRRE